MAVTKYSSASPYAATAQTSWYLEPITLRLIPSSSDDRQITLDPKYQYRPDLLSYDLYNNPSYWWIFMVRNMDVIRDPIWDFQAGIQIYVPSDTRLKQILG